MIFQDNGIGNMLTALLTFPQPYHLPLFGIITRRGGLGEYNSMIHTISERAEALLDAAGVRWFQLDARTPIEDWAPTIERGYDYAHDHPPAGVRAGQPDGRLRRVRAERPDALRLIDAAFPDQPLVLTLGGTIREMLAVVGRKPNHLYSLDAMGQPLAIGLGLALGARGDARGERVVVVEGDGSLLMGFSALATVGHLQAAQPGR